MDVLWSRWNYGSVSWKHHAAGGLSNARPVLQLLLKYGSSQYPRGREDLNMYQGSISACALMKHALENKIYWVASCRSQLVCVLRENVLTAQCSRLQTFSIVIHFNLKHHKNSFTPQQWHNHLSQLCDPAQDLGFIHYKGNLWFCTVKLYSPCKAQITSFYF